MFRLDMVGVENPDEDLSQGPWISFNIAPIPVPKIPRWAIPLAAGLLLVALLVTGGVILFGGPKEVSVADVSGFTQEGAERRLQEDGFRLETPLSRFSEVIARGLVINTDPPAGDKASKGDAVQLILSNGPAPTATPSPSPTSTATPLPSQTPTPPLTPTPTPSPTPTSTSTSTPVPDVLEGPVGGSGGNNFVDEVPRGAKVIGLQIRAGEWVDSIQVFLDTGLLIKHGGNGGIFHQINFADDEYITSVRGYYGGSWITRISIYTNKTVYGPYGNGTKNYFIFAAQPGKQIVGFFGRSADFVNAIGVIIRPRR